MLIYYIKFFSCLFLFFLFIKRKNILNDIPATYLILLLTLSEFIFLNTNSAFHWTLSGDISVLRKLHDKSMLDNDIVTLSNYHSPKIIYYSIIYVITKILSISELFLFYVIKLIILFLTPIIIFFTIVKTLTNKENILFIKDNLFLRFFAFITSIGYLEVFPRIAKLGWMSFNVRTISDPYGVSGFFGLLSLFYLSYYSKFDFKWFSLIFISILIHPVFGIPFLFLSFILFFKKKYYFEFKKNINFFIKYLSYSILIFLYLALLSIYFENNFINTEEFIKIYVYERHPHHYLVSSFLNPYGVLWLVSPLLLVPINLILKRPDKALICFMGGIFFIACIFFQWFFIEIYPSKIIAKLGPARFLSFNLVAIIKFNLSPLFKIFFLVFESIKS